MLKSPFLFAVSVLIALSSWAGVAEAQELNVGLSFDLRAVQEQAAIARPSVVSTHVDIAAAPVKELEDMEPAPIELVKSDDIALTFAAHTVSIRAIPTAENVDSAAAVPFGKAVSFSPAENALSLDDWIFDHETHSLVARTVGSAEGTRQANGRRTKAYYGHTDPGNGVWNLGTFSYQHEATSPEEADKKQLKRLKRQGFELEAQATKIGIALSLEEKLNGLDLANQAPLAALDTGGYIDRLAQAKRLKMAGTEAILWARTHAYIDPNTRRWNAPGLGNNVQSISNDQDRRVSAISVALKAYMPIDMDIAPLAHLEQISLVNTGMKPSRAIAANRHEQHQPLFSTINSDLEISFGLPPVQLEIATNAPPFVVTDIATPISAIRSSAKQTHVSAADLGISFAPIENIAEPVAVASIPNSEISAAPEEDAKQRNTGNDSIESETAEYSNIQETAVKTTELSTLRHENEEIDSKSKDDSATATQGEVSALSDGSVNNAAVSSVAVVDIAVVNIAAVDDTAIEKIVIEDAVEKETAVNNVAQLQSLLAGISTAADPTVINELQNSEQNHGSKIARQFFQTEDSLFLDK